MEVIIPVAAAVVGSSVVAVYEWLVNVDKSGKTTRSKIPYNECKE